MDYANQIMYRYYNKNKELPDIRIVVIYTSEVMNPIEVAKCISDEQEQIQVIAGILVATDKFIDEEYAKKVKEWLRMTKVGRLYEQEKQEEIDKALSAAGMLFKGMSIEEVAKKLDVTIEKVKEWEKRLSH
ncbi:MULTISPECIES: hypothetical protein [Bacillus]|nr:MULTISPECIES: hypothetical protein [Bacillus]